MTLSIRYAMHAYLHLSFHFAGKVLLLLLLPRRVVVAVVATVTSFLCAVVAEPLSCFFIPFFVLFPDCFVFCFRYPRRGCKR